MKTAAWLQVAMQEAGVATFADGNSNPRIEEYHCSISATRWDDKVPWCSSFLHWCMREAGLQGTGSALARSWLDWGIPLLQPQIGCVVILWRDQPESEKGHAGLFLREDDTHVFLWGGNQLDAVREHSYLKTTVLGFRWSAKASSP